MENTKIWVDKVDETETLLTVNEVANHLRMSPHFVRRLIRTGQLPAFKFGSDYRLEPKDVKAYKSICAVPIFEPR